MPNPLLLGWTATTCAYGHACWVVRAVGKTVVMRRPAEPHPPVLLRKTAL